MRPVLIIAPKYDGFVSYDDARTSEKTSLTARMTIADYLQNILQKVLDWCGQSD
jgi:hypothetical protein